MEKFARVVKEGALWIAFFVVATVFCYGVAAVLGIICNFL